MKTRSWFCGVVLAAALCGPAVAASAPDAVIDRLPNPVARTSAADKIASEFAGMDAQFRQQAADCRAQAGPSGFSFRVGARRLIETSTLYSVEVATSWYCGGPYPDSNASAFTFDLLTGAPYDLDRAFNVGSGHLAAVALPIVVKYRQQTLQRIKDRGDCAQLAPDEIAATLQGADLSLGVTRLT